MWDLWWLKWYWDRFPFRVFPVNITPLMLHNHLHFNTNIIRIISGQSLESSNKSTIFRYRGTLGRNLLSRCFYCQNSDHSWAHGHYGFNIQTRYLITIGNGTHGDLTPRRRVGQWYRDLDLSLSVNNGGDIKQIEVNDNRNCLNYLKILANLQT